MSSPATPKRCSLAAIASTASSKARSWSSPAISTAFQAAGLPGARGGAGRSTATWCGGGGAGCGCTATRDGGGSAGCSAATGDSAGGAAGGALQPTNASASAPRMVNLLSRIATAAIPIDRDPSCQIAYAAASERCHAEPISLVPRATGERPKIYVRRRVEFLYASSASHAFAKPGD